MTRVRSTGQQGYRKIAPLRVILELTEIIWIDRSRPGGVSEFFREAMEDVNQKPLVVYPEGTMTGGDMLLKFHRGAFLTKLPIQPVAVRFWQTLVPKGWNTYAYSNPNALEYFWGLVAMPWSVITVDYLPIMIPGEDESVEALALRAQLTLANYLKVRAVDRSSDELFRKKTPPKAKPE
jgi:1-acyl-sn-glycerol-3-phosphate acyltransferase